MRVAIIPRKRILTFIRENNAVIREIERVGSVKLKLTGDELEIEGEGGTEWIAEQVINAICYGFEPKRAYKLFKDEYFLEVVDLDLALHRSEKAIERYKGRVIGTAGKVKKTIESLSGAFIVVGEKKIYVLGIFQEMRVAKEAITRLLEGSTHEKVYQFLERNKKGTHTT